MKSLNIILDNIASLEAELTALNAKLEQEKDNMFNSIVENSPNFTAIVQDEKFVYVNSMGLLLLKCGSSKEIVGESIYEFIDSELHTVIKKLFVEKVYTDVNNPVHLKMLTTDGGFVWMEASSKPFIYNNNNAAIIVGRDITGELIQKQKLEEEENLRALILNSFSELVAFYEPNHRVKWMNNAAKEYYGITDDSYIGKCCHNLRFKADEPCADCPMLYFKDSPTERFVNDKDVIWHVKHTPLFDNEGNISGYIESSVDVTERRYMDELLKNKQQNLEEAQRIGKIGSWELNMQLNKIERSDELYRIYELDPKNESIHPEKYLSVIHPDDRDRVRKIHAESIKSESPYQLEYRLLFADGRVKYVSEHCETFYDKLGNPLRNVGTVQDVTEHKQNQQNIELLGFALNNATEAVFISEDKKINFMYVNDAACQSLGYSRKELLEMTVFDIDPNVTINMLVQMVADMESGKPSVVETVHKKKDGTLFPVEIINTLYQHNNKTYMMNVVQDISERKRAEEALSSSEAELRSLINAMTDVIFVGDSEGRYLKIADTHTSVLYKPSNELLGKTLFEVFPKAQADYFFGYIRQTLDTQEPVNFEYSLFVDNIEYWFNATISPMSDDKYLMVARDITEQKRKQIALIEAEEKLRESEQRYREIFNNSHDSISLLEVLEDSHFRLLAVNDQYLKEIGVTREQFVGNTVEENVSLEDAALVNAKYQHCVDTGAIYTDTIELNMPKGLCTYHSTLIPVHDNTGKVYRLMAVSRDITDELKNKLELEKSRNLLSDAEVIASLGNFYMDFTNDKFHCSKGVYNILGLPFKEETSENLDIFKFIHVEDAKRVRLRLRSALDAKTKFDEILRVIDNSGIEKVIHAIGSFVTDLLGNELFLGNVHDVSDVHSLTKQVVLGEEKMKMLAENSPLGILISSGTTPLFINQTFLDLCGVSSMEEFAKLDPNNLVHPNDRGSAMKLFRKILEDKHDEPSSYQLMLRGSEVDGRAKIFDLRVTSCWMDDNKYIQILINDITDEIEKEKMMSRMASDSLYISQRNSIVSNVKKELDDILYNKCGKCIQKTHFRNTLNVLDTYSKSENDWGLFNKHFENLHPGFISNLKILCPTLTVTDIKHCACIRLNVDTKETARFFNVSPASIQTSRVRLKKKLNLPEAIDLREFIENI